MNVRKSFHRDDPPAKPVRPTSASRIRGATAEQLADAMFALSAPSRVEILGCLMDGPLSVGELTSLVDMEQSAVSHQLRVLREHALVTVKREGKRRLYALDDDAVRELFAAAIRHIERRARASLRTSAVGE